MTNEQIAALACRIERLDGHYLWIGHLINGVPVISDSSEGRQTWRSVRSWIWQHLDPASLERAAEEHERRAHVRVACGHALCVRPAHLRLRNGATIPRAARLEFRRRLAASLDTPPPGVRGRPAAERFRLRCRPADGHLEWTGSFLFIAGGAATAPHRWLWQVLGLPLKRYQHLRNTCGNRRCIHPLHHVLIDRSRKRTWYRHCQFCGQQIPFQTTKRHRGEWVRRYNRRWNTAICADCEPRKIDADAEARAAVAQLCQGADWLPELQHLTTQEDTL